MFARMICVIAISIACPLAAHANWLTEIEADVFSGGNQVFMTSDPTDAWIVVGSCSDANGIRLSVVEGNKTDAADGRDPSTIIVKPDNGNRVRADGTFYRHNANSVGVSFDDAFMIPVALQAMGKADRSISLGLRIETTGYQQTRTISARGSKKATDAFMEACGLD